jgi:Ca2+-binding RTX toxin-like protein
MADFYGTSGDDSIYGSGNNDNIYGGSGNDYLFGLSGDDNIYGDSGNDNIYGDSGNDNIYGDSGNDNIFGFGGDDNIYGDSGSDYIFGGEGLDAIYGGEGDDFLSAYGEGNDQLFGGNGNDLYYVIRTTDSITEGFNQGIDNVDSSVTYDLSQSNANLENLSLSGATNIHGTGNSLGNQITGNSGNNYLDGSAGNDTLNGGAGNDVLNGGAGNDVLTGGGGSDQFAFVSLLPGVGLDIITDFNVFSSDRIILRKPSFSSLETVGGYPPDGNPLMAGDFSVINVAAPSEVAMAETSQNEIVYNVLTGSLFYNANDNMPGFGIGGGQFATLVGSPDYLSYTSIRVTF